MLEEISKSMKKYFKSPHSNYLHKKIYMKIVQGYQNYFTVNSLYNELCHLWSIFIQMYLRITNFSEV